MLADARIESHRQRQDGDEVKAVKGRSLWQDAGRRFLKNRAAVVCLDPADRWSSLFTFIGPFFATGRSRRSTGAILGKVPQKGAPVDRDGPFLRHGRDRARSLFARHPGHRRFRSSVGILGSAVAVVVGTLYGAIAGYFGGRLDSAMMRFVDIIYSIPFMFILILC